MKLHYWHVMDAGKDSVDLLRRLLDRFGTGLQLRAGAQPGARQRLQRRSSSRASRRARSAWARTSSRSRSCTRARSRRSTTRSSSFWKAKSVRQGRQRPRPDGPAARQDVAARRLSRDRRRRRLTPSAGVDRSAARAAFARRGAAALTAAPWLARWRRAAPTSPRFALGIASGQPRADGMVLWTRLTGADLAERVDVRWEVADDERFQHVVARGEEIAEAAWAHSVHAEPAGLAPARWYWYRFSALGQQSAVGRTRTAPAADAARDACASRSRAASATTSATTPPGATSRPRTSTSCMFVGDYIYEYASRQERGAPLEGGEVVTLDEYRARYATHKSDPLAAGGARAPRRGSLVWDDHEVVERLRQPAGPDLEVDIRARARRRLPRLLGAHAVPEVGAAASAPTCASSAASTGARWRASTCSTTASTATRRPARSPAAAARTRCRSRDCPALADPKRTLLGAEQERWLADGWDLARPWNLLAQQTLMARFAWSDPADGGGVYWTDGWDGYAPSRNRLLGVVAEQKRARRRRPRRRRPQQLRRRPEGRLRRPGARRSSRASSAAPRSPACRSRSRGSTRRAPSTRTSATAAPTSAAT